MVDTQFILVSAAMSLGFAMIAVKAYLIMKYYLCVGMVWASILFLLATIAERSSGV